MPAIKTLFTVAAATAVLSGCGTLSVGESDFKCGTPDNPKCASVLDAYENSHGPDRTGGKRAGKSARAAESLPPGAVPVLNAATDDANWPKPVLEPAKVMRIWVAPWVDDKETLHWPSYVFTEIAGRKWSYGQPDFRGVKQLVPVQAERRPAAKESDGKSDNKKTAQ